MGDNGRRARAYPVIESGMTIRIAKGAQRWKRRVPIRFGVQVGAAYWEKAGHTQEVTSIEVSRRIPAAKARHPDKAFEDPRPALIVAVVGSAEDEVGYEIADVVHS